MNRRIISLWLFICAFMVFAMIGIGGYTRLQGAGLSIVEWKPIRGIALPSNNSEWLEEFDLYKNSPEYRSKNFGMTLAEFKRIYFIEYFHRLIGRVTGLIFLAPFIYFILRKQISSRDVIYLSCVFLLGGLQGALGWYMVKSGLYKDPHVSHYRLAMHLVLAIVVYGLLFWKALDYYFESRARKGVRFSYYALIILIMLQITLGGFVAGLKGGLVYNTFPLMDGHLIPRGLFALHPWYMNFLDNIVMIQFAHRALAVTILIYATYIWALNRCVAIKKPWRILMWGLSLQVTLGVATLLMFTPMYLALIHQALAILIFTNLLWIIHSLRCGKFISLH